MMKNLILIQLLFVPLTSFLTFQAIAQESPAERFQELTGTWIVTETSFIDPPQGTMEVIPSADGKAIYSTFKRGNGDTYYEANALWGYSESNIQVRVFEVNNFGVAVTHIGYFDKNGTLITELRDAETNNWIQYREMTWDKQTYEMKAQFWKEGKKINHHMLLKRQPNSKHKSSAVNTQPEELSEINLQKEERQIRRLWKEASECIRSGNWESYKNCWKQNSEFQVIHPFQGEWFNGWVQIREKYKKLLQSGGRFTTLKDDLTLNISKSGNMAWGTMDVIFQIGEDKNNTVHVWETAAFEKVNGEWKFVMEMACSPKNSNKNAQEDLEAINQIRDNHVKAVNESNVELLLQDMSEDIIYLAPGLQPIEGKEALKEFITPVYEVVAIKIQMTPEEIEIKNNTVIEWGLINGEMKQNEMDSIQYVKNKYLFVYEKLENNKWIITKDIYTTFN